MMKPASEATLAPEEQAPQPAADPAVDMTALYDDAPFSTLIWNAARLTHAAEQRVAPHDPNRTAFALTLMWLVHREPEREISHYAQRMSLDMATLGRQVNTIVSAGEMMKTADQNDRRIRRLALTERGREVLARQRERVRAFDHWLSDRLGPERYGAMSADLTAFLGAVRPGEDR